jgi:hypothetical protein
MSTTTPDRTTILAQIAAISRLNREEMQERWRELFHTDPPGYGPDLIRRRLIYRIQELAYGGLSAATRQRLREIDAAAQAKKKEKTRTHGIPIAGTVLIKEWGGDRHEVTVLSAGFQYRGEHFASLSRVAEKITGTHWNGLRFFGLRTQKPALRAEA